MRDAHIHFEFQPYSFDILDKMVQVALSRGVTELCLLDHTHFFEEFAFLYDETKTDPETYKHYVNKKLKPLSTFMDFIIEVRKRNYPVKLLFGLEVCYFPNKEKQLKEVLDKYRDFFDFYIGSVHHIDGFGYDLGEKDWEGKNVDHLYRRFFELEEQLVDSRLFDHLAHPDAIKKYGHIPSFSLLPYYESIAKKLKEVNMSTENSSGFDRYGLTNIGLNEDFYKALKKHNVKIYRASDAHTYDYIGNKFDILKI